MQTKSSTNISKWKPSKRINDSLHGAIFLSDLEFSIVSTPAFLRLANVKQLGLGSYVYPGASYSRLSHSIGACHVVGQILDAIERNTGKRIDYAERVITRLAALMHDIGHYPFSHTTESVVNDLKALSLLSVNDTGAETKYFEDHEKLGMYVIENDQSITALLKKGGVNPSDITARIDGGSDEGNLKYLISSDLDCDRLDYLRRTALHAGQPFGGIDAEYLIDNMTFDDFDMPCLQRKAIGSADHFLISRLYDYEQLPFHKAVVGFEIALKKTLQSMAKAGEIKLDRTSIEERIDQKTWRRFDDQETIESIRKFYDKNINNDSTTPYIESILNRKSPKLFFDLDYIVEIDEHSEENFATQRKRVTETSKKICDELGIDNNLVEVWSNSFPLSKDFSSGKSIKILKDVIGEKVSHPISNEERTLCSQMENFHRKHIRMYICLSQKENPKEIRNDLKRRMNKELSDLLDNLSGN